MVTQSQKHVGAAEFKTHCLNLLSNVNQTEIVITKHGRPVAKLIPYKLPEADEHHTIAGCMAGTIEITGDIMAPLEDWDALTDEMCDNLIAQLNELDTTK